MIYKANQNLDSKRSIPRDFLSKKVNSEKRHVVFYNEDQTHQLFPPDNKATKKRREGFY